MRILRILFVAMSLALLLTAPAEARKRRAVRSPSAPVVQPPVASADGFVTNQNAALTVPAPGVLANDTLNGATLVSYGATTGAEQPALGATTATSQGGVVSMQSDGSVAFTPAAGFSGNDTFRYFIANAGGTSSAEVTVIVQPVAEFDFEIQSPGFFFTFSGVSGENPAIPLERGRTYRFKVNTAPSHPFEIREVPPGSVTNNGISQGTLTFVVPNNAESYPYWCPIHDFGNNFVVP